MIAQRYSGDIVGVACLCVCTVYTVRNLCDMVAALPAPKIYCVQFARETNDDDIVWNERVNGGMCIAAAVVIHIIIVIRIIESTRVGAKGGKKTRISLARMHGMSTSMCTMYVHPIWNHLIYVVRHRYTSYGVSEREYTSSVVPTTTHRTCTKTKTD